jgi:hypothetical protein
VTGAPDASFGSGGSIALDVTAADLALDPEGRVVVLGWVWVPRVSATLDLSRRLVDRPVRVAYTPVGPGLLRLPF